MTNTEPRTGPASQPPTSPTAPAATRPKTRELTAADRCDRCGAQAYYLVVMPGGADLVFCRHHGQAYEERLHKVAVEVVDQTDRMRA